MRYQILLLIVTLAVSACQQATETVEIKDEAGNVIEKFQLRASDDLKHGFYKKYDENGKIIEEVEYSEGLKNGKRVIYYANGNPMEEETYEDDILAGEVKSYFENGKIKAITPYVLRNGESVMEGMIKTYYENGQLRAEAKTVNSEINGPFVEYHENGIIKAKGRQIADEDGIARDDGLLELYDSTGVLIKKMDCILGRCETIESGEGNK